MPVTNQKRKFKQHVRHWAEKLEESLRVISNQKKRSLAEALMDIPRLNTDTDELFKRPPSYSRNVDQS